MSAYRVLHYETLAEAAPELSLYSGMEVVAVVPVPVMDMTAGIEVMVRCGLDTWTGFTRTFPNREVLSDGGPA